jgi:acetylornithine deacetylase/succinyl-diaminopimelate desuccinylase-like protein
LNQISQFVTDPIIETLQARLASISSRIVEDAVTIQQIPSPTFSEQHRAEYVRQRFEFFGLDSIEIDSVYNVYGRLPGRNASLPGVLVSAHTDTVFEADTVLDTRHENGRVYGPGLGDNSLGVAALLALAELLSDQHLPADIWFVANSREEGMGNLDGIRAAYQKLAARIGTAIVVEGMAFGRIYHGGIAVRRLEITCHTEGGHSWLHFGQPSAIHGLVQLGADITRLSIPTTPRTTYNIGVIEGGQSVNSIASSASMLLDMRSESRQALEALETQVRSLVDKHYASGIEFEVKVVGDRPGGELSRSHPLVMLARDILLYLGTQPIFETGSTDANVLLASGLPTVTVGITYGGNAHRLDEFIEIGLIQQGLWQLVLLTVGATNGLAGQNLALP